MMLKRVCGRKRHIVSRQEVLSVVVHAADVQGDPTLIADAFGGPVSAFWADGAYAGSWWSEARSVGGRSLERGSEGRSSLAAGSWSALSHLGCRLSKDYEELPETTEAWVYGHDVAEEEAVGRQSAPVTMPISSFKSARGPIGTPLG